MVSFILLSFSILYVAVSWSEHVSLTYLIISEPWCCQWGLKSLTVKGQTETEGQAVMGGCSPVVHVVLVLNVWWLIKPPISPDTCSASVLQAGPHTALFHSHELMSPESKQTCNDLKHQSTLYTSESRRSQQSSCLCHLHCVQQTKLHKSLVSLKLESSRVLPRPAVAWSSVHPAAAGFSLLSPLVLY